LILLKEISRTTLELISLHNQMDHCIYHNQHGLIKQILANMNFQQNTSLVPCPACIGKVLTKHSDYDKHKTKWHYHSIIGKLNFLEKSTRPDLAFAVHNAARFSINPREPHSNARESTTETEEYCCVSEEALKVIPLITKTT
jgi:hypothetical protein